MSHPIFPSVITHLACLQAVVSLVKTLFLRSFLFSYSQNTGPVEPSGVEDTSVFLGVSPIRGITHKHVISSGKAASSWDASPDRELVDCIIPIAATDTFSICRHQTGLKCDGYASLCLGNGGCNSAVAVDWLTSDSWPCFTLVTSIPIRLSAELEIKRRRLPVTPGNNSWVEHYFPFFKSTFSVPAYGQSRSSQFTYLSYLC